MNAIDLKFLVAAIVVITSALVFYTIGVWAERIQKELRGWHVFCFLLGISADIVGTSFMAELVRLTGKDNELHEITGLIAVALMAIHASWAVWTYWKGSAKAKRSFSKLSLVVWMIWLIPYCIGIYLGVALHQ